MNTVSTSGEAIDVLGGTAWVSRLTGRSLQAVSNWRDRGFPADTFIVLTEALADRGYVAPPSLWGMVERQRQEALA